MESRIMFQAAPSDTKSSFRYVNFRFLSFLLLCCVVLLWISTETLVRGGLSKSSRIEGRIDGEHRALLSVTSEPGPVKLLVIGNSLLNAGVDFPEFQNSMGPGFKASRYVIEQTNFLDWYYGLRRLYKEGVRADFVVLPLSARQIIADGVRGEYFAYRMMNAGDFLDAARDAKLSATGAFSLLLGRWSAFYGTRSETRKFILSKTVPGVTGLVSYLSPGADPNPLDHERTVRAAAQRFKRIDELVRNNGGHFVFIVPASLDPHEEMYLEEAGRSAEISLLVPMRTETLSSIDFSDGFHLNPAGASRFTRALVLNLQEAIATIQPQAIRSQND